VNARRFAARTTPFERHRFGIATAAAAGRRRRRKVADAISIGAHVRAAVE
jgi:hypothetical protein